MRKRVLLLETDDRDIDDLVLAPIREQVVIHLAAADDDPADVLRLQPGIIADDGVEVSLREIVER